MAITAQDLIDAILDRGTFTSWDRPLLDVHPDAAYAASLQHARSDRTTTRP